MGADEPLPADAAVPPGEAVTPDEAVPPDDDPTGTYGQQPLEALFWWLIASGLLLLLPRQWGAAAMAFVFAAIVRVTQKRRSRAEQPPDG